MRFPSGCADENYHKLMTFPEETRAARLHALALALRHTGDGHRAAMRRGKNDRQVALLHREEIGGDESRAIPGQGRADEEQRGG